MAKPTTFGQNPNTTLFVPNRYHVQIIWVRVSQDKAIPISPSLLSGYASTDFETIINSELTAGYIFIDSTVLCEALDLEGFKCTLVKVIFGQL